MHKPNPYFCKNGASGNRSGDQTIIRSLCHSSTWGKSPDHWENTNRPNPCFSVPWLLSNKPGAEHPHVASLLYQLADLYTEQGRYEQAEPLFHQALRIWEYKLGFQHPEIVAVLVGLGHLWLAQGKNEQAQDVLLRALAILEQHRGQAHPDTAHTLHELALLRQRQGRLEEALALAERALSIREQVLGEVHPKTVATCTLYAQLRAVQANVQTQERGSIPRSTQATPAFPTAEQDPLEGFLAACCELNPLAWCTIRELWDTYERWTATEQGCVPLPRRAFAALLQARGCRGDRTSTARIWRGIRPMGKSL